MIFLQINLEIKTKYENGIGRKKDHVFNEILMNIILI